MKLGKKPFRPHSVLRQAPWSIRIGIPAALLLLYIIFSAFAFKMLAPNSTWVNALYMTIITITTLGSRDSATLAGQAGEIWTMIVIIGGLILASTLGAMITSFIVEGRILGVFGRQKVRKKIESLKGHVVVCGYGRTGRHVAKELADAGEKILIVDIDEKVVDTAFADGFLCIHGDAQEDHVQAGLRLTQAKILITCLSDDAGNLFLTLSARQENPGLFIISRASQESSQNKLRRAGANKVICPQLTGASRIVDLVLRPAMVDFVDMTHSGVDLEMDRVIVTADSPLQDQTLEELELPRKAGAHIVAVRHANGETNYIPSRHLKLIAGDTLILVGRKGVSDAISKVI